MIISLMVEMPEWSGDVARAVSSARMRQPLRDALGLTDSCGHLRGRCLHASGDASNRQRPRDVRRCPMMFCAFCHWTKVEPGNNCPKCNTYMPKSSSIGLDTREPNVRPPSAARTERGSRDRATTAM
jgi:hypothetical protein